MDIDKFDIVTVGLSGGKDSTALALWVKFESGWDMSKVVFTFCETGNEDPFTYAFLGYLESVIGDIVVINPGETLYELSMRKSRFPSAKARFCTQSLKIYPKHDLLSLFVDHGLRPLNVTGVRRQEGKASNNRGDAELFDYDVFRCRDSDYIIDTCHPLAYWSLDDVWDIHKRHLSIDAIADIIDADKAMSESGKSALKRRLSATGIPRNPLYDIGSTRVGCFPCINSRKSEIKSMAKWRPERIDFIRDWELAISEHRQGEETYSGFLRHHQSPEIFVPSAWSGKMGLSIMFARLTMQCSGRKQAAVESSIRWTSKKSLRSARSEGIVNEIASRLFLRLAQLSKLSTTQSRDGIKHDHRRPS